MMAMRVVIWSMIWELSTRAGSSSDFATGGQGPRGLALSPDGRLLAVAHYFSGDVALYDAESARQKPTARIAIGDQAEPDLVRRGEILFHDAGYSFQGWLSCATCHPNEARVDGMNWDLLNDGIGNPKNNRSLLWSDRTPPMMSLGIRETMEQAILKGVYFLRRQPEPEEEQALAAYLRSLTPLASPHLEADGSLSAQAARGREIFRSEETGCVSCHAAATLHRTQDLRCRDTRSAGSNCSLRHTDTCRTIPHRTLPARRLRSHLREVLTTRNVDDRHGQTSHLSPQEIDELAAFLMSL